jgi:uncharacterized membrane protein
MSRSPVDSAPRWAVIFSAAFAALLLGLLFSPGFPLEWKMYAVVHGICAQQNNIYLGGLQFPLCARNSGIYLSFLLTMLLIALRGRSTAARPPHWSLIALLLLFVAVMGVDGFNSLFRDLGMATLYEPDNFLRTLSGMGMGIAVAVVVQLMLVNTLRADADYSRPIIGWRDLLLIIVVDLLVLAAIYGNLSITFWPLAFLAFFGIIGVLYSVLTLLTAVIMGFENKVTDLRQLARPATVALVPTLLMMALMSWLRFQLEAAGLQL